MSGYYIKSDYRGDSSLKTSFPSWGVQKIVLVLFTFFLLLFVEILIFRCTYLWAITYTLVNSFFNGGGAALMV